MGDPFGALGQLTPVFLLFVLARWIYVRLRYPGLSWNLPTRWDEVPWRFRIYALTLLAILLIWGGISLRKLGIPSSDTPVTHAQVATSVTQGSPATAVPQIVPTIPAPNPVQPSAPTPIDLKQVFADPDFKALSPLDKGKVLAALDPNYRALAPKEQSQVLDPLQQSATDGQKATPTDNTSLAKPVDWGTVTARLFADDSDRIGFVLATSWIPGENHKGILRYRLDVSDISISSNPVQLTPDWVDIRERMMLRVHTCSITLILYDADKFVLRKISASLALGVDDQTRVESLKANDSVQMDAQDYRKFIGPSNGGGGSWNVSWSCGPATLPR